ncbi:MAG: LexA family transcriptional repressor, repressor LexA [Candidatus Peregrinibacteria bacterium GW2011_GWE2_39_6]|nr:MAG: LexA family transcriptional repressor, repressor LexA [Candidatus Peregrinibacteria bacterium GW2011_GWF2_39_17]KKR24108.1 MAG: LexA family transcriptional repressor, repressor LexA [Candidatus Peregrinibacteria bacterium GW2011_GWE2_39_6]HCW32763.1 repressor LexA [Candidatus Peregrinibacteria bacterium]
MVKIPQPLSGISSIDRSNPLTEKQQKLFEFIEHYQWEHGSSPTLREMREYFGVSSDNGVLKHLKALEEKGFIQKADTPRGIKLLNSIKAQLEAAADMVKIPIVGTIPAGGPILAEENILGVFEMGKGFLNPGKGAFLLRVSGNSMINAGIHEGDMVLVSPRKEVDNRDIVVALVDGESTVKRYMKNGQNVYLKAENPDYSDIYPNQELSVQGVVTGLIRHY